MIPFARMLEYGNKAAGKEYKIYSSSNAVFILDLSTKKLYGTGGGYSIGLDSNAIYSTFTLCAENVKRVFGQGRSSSSNFVMYQSLDNKIYAAGDTRILTGDNINLPWTDKTSMFTSIGITNMDDIKDITCFYNLKINLVLNDGSLYCSGVNSTNQATSFGDGTDTNSMGAFRFISTIPDVKVADGNYYLTTGGLLYGTGRNNQYQLGDNSTVSINTLKQLSTDVMDFGVAISTAYYIKNNTLYAMGTQLSATLGNELGAGSSSTKTVFRTATVMSTDSTKIFTAVGNSAVHSISSSLLMRSTGINNGGQLSTGNSSGVFTLTTTKQIVGNDYQFVRCSGGTLLLDDGKLYYCGYSNFVMGNPGQMTLVLTEVPLSFMQ